MQQMCVSSLSVYCRPKGYDWSEGEVVARTGSGEVADRRRGESGFGRHISSTLGSSVVFLGFPTADACEPSSVVLAAFYIEAESDVVANIEGILVSTVAKEVEVDFAGNCVLCFKHIFALFPGSSRLRSTAHLGESNNDFSFDFHYIGKFMFLFRLQK